MEPLVCSLLLTRATVTDSIVVLTASYLDSFGGLVSHSGFITGLFVQITYDNLTTLFSAPVYTVASTLLLLLVMFLVRSSPHSADAYDICQLSFSV